ncbi:MAG: hypothetical protein ACD_3C00205G0001, partial [uncultured bacterium (gcode 4)]
MLIKIFSIGINLFYHTSLGGLMYKSIVIFICLLSLLLPVYLLVFEAPVNMGYVSDHAGLLSKDYISKKSRDLSLYESSTSNKLCILTVPDLQGQPISSFSIKVAETWKTGRKDRDNGVIITIAKAERKVRIEVGQGLEGRLTDKTCGQIIRNYMAPKLKDWKTEEALDAAIPQIMLAVKGEFKGDGKTSASVSKSDEDIGKILLSI